MKKRSKVRIPQDIKPWVRVKEVLDDDDEPFALPDKKTIRGRDRRDRLTKALNAQEIAERSKLLLKSLFFDQEPVRASAGALRRACLLYKLSKINRMASEYRPKNTCLFLGRGRTYNRRLFMARHTFRRMMRFGLIPGMQKP